MSLSSSDATGPKRGCPRQLGVPFNNPVPWKGLVQQYLTSSHSCVQQVNDAIGVLMHFAENACFPEGMGILLKDIVVMSMLDMKSSES